jgi:asparagine synthase (glutamine-hydrolysing)
MCGIVVFLNCGSEFELNNAVDCVNHRGPDYSAIKWFKDKKSGIGHARLSIIDLSEGGSQPMYDSDSGNWIVYNGEVYNYKEIKLTLSQKGHNFSSNSDTEVILKAYAEWGEKCLEKLNGMFAFTIYNNESGQLFACRDRLGIKPFYFYQKGNKLAIASEIKSILSCSDYKKAPDIDALHTPVHFQIAPNTGFRDISKLEAGHYLKYNDGKIEIKKYWDLNPTEEIESESYAVNMLEELLLDSIQLQMISDVPVGALLSGGLDSSLICVMMQKYMNQPLNTFTIKFKDEDLKRQGNVDDSYFARQLAGKFNFNHNEIVIEPDIVNLLTKMIYHLEEPIADPAAINTYLISTEARRRGMKVLLSGMGADEVFSGYRSHLACLKADTYQKVPSSLRNLIENVSRYIPSSNDKRDFKYIRWVKDFLKIASLSQVERALVINNSALSSESFPLYFTGNPKYHDSHFVKKSSRLFADQANISYQTRLCFNDTKIYLPDHNLAYMDKAMMAASIEGRPPLIDHRIVEFAFKLSPKLRIKNNTQKYILKKVAEKYLPNNIIYRPKAPFSAPMRGWLKNELKEMVNDVLSFDAVEQRGVYNPHFVMQLIGRNEKGIEDNSQLIWRLMVNEIWFQTFFDKN